MTEDRFERSLRELLADRDPGPAPERLRRAVVGVPAMPAGARGAAWLAGLPGLAAAAIIVAVGIGLLLRAGSAPQGSGGAPQPAPPASLEPGMGLATATEPVLPVLILFLVLPAVGIILAWRLRSRIGRLAIVSLMVALMVGYGSLAFIDVLSFRDGAIIVAPATLDSETDGKPTHLALVKPGELFRVLLTVTNVSAVPVTLRGLDPSLNDIHSPVAKFVGLGLLADPQEINPAAAVAFRPVELAPDGHVDVVVLLDAGPCATEPGQDVGSTGRDYVPFVSSALGWERTTRVEMPFTVAVPIQENCP